MGCPRVSLGSQVHHHRTGSYNGMSLTKGTSGFLEITCLETGFVPTYCCGEMLLVFSPLCSLYGICIEESEEVFLFLFF